MMRKIMLVCCFLWSFTLTGGVRGDDPHLIPQDPFWSPDGTTIIFWSLSMKTWIINSDGTDLQPSGFPSASQTIMPKWSPDGQWIAAASNRYSKSDLLLYDVAANEFLNFTPDIDQPIGTFEWSPDSSSIAFTTYQMVAERRIDTLWIKSLDGALVEITPLFEMQILSLSWSFDGQQLAYTGQSNTTGGIFLSNIATNTFQVIGSPYWLGLWHPQNIMLLALKACPQGYNDVVLIDISTNVESTLTGGRCDAVSLPPVWSPDGKYVLYLSANRQIGNEFDLMLIEVATATISNLTADLVGDISDPSWSPNSEAIVFVMSESSDANLWTLTIKNNTLMKLTSQ